MTGVGRWAGIVLVSAIVLMAAMAPWLAPYDPNLSSGNVLGPPAIGNLFGTDDLGRDVFSRVIFGARVSLVIGLAATCVGMAIGIPVGLAAGYARGRFDAVAVQLIDLFIALPAIVVALIVTAAVGVSLQTLVLTLGALKWPVIARIVRGQVLVLRELPFIEAARATGCSLPRILLRHVVPNILRVVAAQFSIATASAIFTAASLSFLGLGLPPPAADWGGMVESGFNYLFLNPLLCLAPGVAVTVTVIGFHLIGKGFEGPTR